MTSKELVISQSRHETKVAILEDGQLVELFFQRANEYSLAGSIHKGRVTRVLPGMQSAFVDLGLDRDCFLYVSDFFEEHADEIDRVDDRGREAREPRESRGRDRDRGREREPRESESVLALPATAEIGPEVAAAAPTVESAVSAGPPPVTGQEQGPAAGEAQRERRGRRSRRRRRGSRGFPEAKYASPESGEGDSEAPSDEATDAVEAVAGEPEEAIAAPAHEEFLLLPGESLAKYRRNQPAVDRPAAKPVAHAPVVKSDVAHAVPEELDTVEDDATEAILDRIDEMEEKASAAAELAVVGMPVGTTSTESEADGEPGAESDAEADETEAEPEPEHLSAKLTPPVAPESNLAAPRHPRNSDLQAPPAAAAAEELSATDIPEAAESIEEQAAVAEPAEPAPVTALEAADETAVANSDEDATGEAGGVEVDEPEAENGETAEGEAPAAGDAGSEARPQGGRIGHRMSRRMRRRSRHHSSGEPVAATPDAIVAVPPEPAAAEAPEFEPASADGGRSAERAERGNRDRESRDRGRDRDKDRERPPLPSISDLLKEGQEIIVQIAKEPLGQKGARITSHIALPGRYVVYMPTVEHLGVSRKIGSDEERLRLKKILQKHREGVVGGFIMRTAGEGRTEEEIAADIAYLANLWLEIRAKAERRRAPLLLHHDVEVVQRLLRDQLTDGFKAVWVDNEELYEQTLHAIERIAPQMLSRVKMYTRPEPIFDAFSITQELEKALRPKVWLKSGGYIVINQTEALVAIDVNTGKYVGKSNRLEDTIVKTNLEAVKEIVRQVRLRDLGGIIVVDFIDMDERKNRQKVMLALEEAMRVDKAPYKILQFNDFGMVAITRKRVKQSLERALCSPCPYCEGAGYVKSVPTVIGEILVEAQKYAKVVDGKECVLRANPEVTRLMKSTDNKYLEELEEILGRPVLVLSDQLLHQEKFDLT